MSLEEIQQRHRKELKQLTADSTSLKKSAGSDKKKVKKYSFTLEKTNFGTNCSNGKGTFRKTRTRN
jgi:hypothetical protein